MNNSFSVNYSLNGKNIDTIKINKNCTVSDFISQFLGNYEINERTRVYLQGRRLNKDELLYNCIDNLSTDVFLITNYVDKWIDDYKIVKPFFKKSSISKTSNSNNYLTQKTGKSFIIYTTATINSLLIGHKLNLFLTDNYVTISKKIRKLINKIKTPDIPKNFEMHIFLPCGIPLLPFDDPTETTLFSFFETNKNWNYHLYVVVTRELGDFIDLEVNDPCNCHHFNKYMLSPLFESTTAGLTQIASFLGYLYHNGIYGEHLMNVFAKTIRFPPLIVNIYRLIEHAELNVRNIIAITGPLFTYIHSHISLIENNKIYEYLLSFISYFGLVEGTEYLEMKTFDLDSLDDDDDENICEYCKYTNQQNHVVIWTYDSIKSQFNGFNIDARSDDVLYEKSIFEAVNKFKPISPLWLPLIHNPTFVIGENEEEVYLFINEEPDKKGFVNYIDPKIGKIEQASINDLALKYNNQEKGEVLNVFNYDGIEQLVVICFDQSLSMKMNLKGNEVKEGELSRSQIAIQLLQNLFNEFIKQGESTILQFISFNSVLNCHQNEDIYLPEFINEFNEIDSNDKTLLFDELKEARNLINKVNTNNDDENEICYPNARTRIIVISDGEDNHSDSSSKDLIDYFTLNGIVVDTILVSEKDDENTKKMCILSKMTGGLCFKLTENYKEVLEIIKQEAFIDITKRYYNPPFDKTKIDYELNNEIYKIDKEIFNKNVIKGNYSFPLATPYYMHRLYYQNIKSYQFCRALKQLEFIRLHPSNDFVVYSFITTPENWRIFIKGPDKTPFENKWLNCFMVLPFKYPIQPPSFYFLTIPFHPNISSDGKVLFSLVNNKYKHDLTIYSIIEGIVNLLKNPEENEEVNFIASELFKSDKNAFLERQRKGETGKNHYNEYLYEAKIFDL